MKTILALLIVVPIFTATAYSCVLVRDDKKPSLSVEKTKADAAKFQAETKRLEYYRSYIEKDLPFKNVLWEAVFSGEQVRNLTRKGDSLYVETYHNRLYSINAENGFRQWQIQLPSAIDFLIATVGELPKKESELKKSILTTEKKIGDELRRKDKDEEKIRLLKSNLGILKEEFLSLRLKDVLYLSSHGSLYCIDRLSGNILWRSRLEFAPSTTPCATLTSIFVGAMDFCRVYQIDAELKYPKKWFKADDPISTTPLYENIVVYFGTHGGKIYAYHMLDNKLLWTYQAERAIRTDMILDEDVIYIGSTDFAVYALDRYAGTVLWKFETGGPISLPMVLDKNPLVASEMAKKPQELSSPETIEKSPESDSEQKKEMERTLYVHSDTMGLYALDLITTSIFIQDPSDPDRKRERVLKRAIPLWRFSDGRSFFISGQKYMYVIGEDNKTLYSVIKMKRDDKQIKDLPVAIRLMQFKEPQIKERYSLALFPYRYCDLENNTVYLGSPDGYIFAVKEQ
jgi:hypothetical protein